MGDFITLKEVLAYMDAGKKFSISFITCDKRQKSAGELIKLSNVTKHNWIESIKNDTISNGKVKGDLIKKDPQHYQNSTRNIVMQGGVIRKVHIRLIRRFNDKTVV